MKYQVPQFIEIEDKIFGPLTLKQFLYLGGGAGLAFVVWSFLPSFIAFLIIIPIGAISAALAFYKYNQRPLIITMESAIKYAFNRKLYIWKKRENKPDPKKIARGNEDAPQTLALPKMSDSKLKELTWSLDISQNLSGVENKTDSL